MKRRAIKPFFFVTPLYKFFLYIYGLFISFDIKAFSKALGRALATRGLKTALEVLLPCG